MLKRLLTYSFMMTLIFTVCIGVGNAATEEREVGSFRNIAMTGTGTLVLSQGEKESLTVQTDDYSMRCVKTVVDNGTLHLYIDSKGKSINIPILQYKVVVKDLKKLKLSGETHVVGNGKLTLNTLNINESGASSIQLGLQANRVDSSVSGASSIELTGSATTHSLSLSGTSSFVGYNLTTMNSSVSVSGMSNAQVYATEYLDIYASGMSKVYYKGAPAGLNRAASRMAKIYTQDGRNVTPVTSSGTTTYTPGGMISDGNIVGGNVITVNGRQVTGAEAQAVQQQVLGGLSGMFGSVGSVSIGGTTTYSGPKSAYVTTTSTGYDSSDSDDDSESNEFYQQLASHKSKVIPTSEITDVERQQIRNALGMFGARVSTLGCIQTSRGTINGPWTLRSGVITGPGFTS